MFINPIFLRFYMNEQTYETGTSVKVYYPMDKELQEKADQFRYGHSNAKYVTLENNPFGLKAGIFFTGSGIREAVSKTRTNAMIGAVKYKDIGSAKWRKRHDYILTVIKALASETIVSAKGKLKGGEMFETQYDVETNDLSFDEFFYDEKKHQIYRYVIVI